jgi:predicted flavoprotein YhiN
MGIVPLHLQRRFEQRWAAQFGSKVVPSVPANVGLKGSPDNAARRAAKAKEKPAGLSRRVRSQPLAV